MGVLSLESRDLSTQDDAIESINKLIINGDLSGLSDSQKLVYYKYMCERIGVDYTTNPFDYIKLQGKLTLYAKRACTDQLRNIHKISIHITKREMIEGVYVVTALAKAPDGREDESTGAVAASNLKGDALANAIMKAETKAKRRVTLSICGLGMLDESEIETIPASAQSSQLVQSDKKDQDVVSQMQDDRKPSEAQLRRLFAITKKHGISFDEIKSYIHNFGLVHSKDMSLSQYNELCNSIESGRFKPQTPVSDEEFPPFDEFEQGRIDQGEDPRIVK